MSKLTSFVAVCSTAALLLLAPLAHGATAGVAISQLYAGGGNAGATFLNDYAELVNRSSAPVSVSGWTLQYASAASTSWQAVPLSGTIRAGGYYLVKLASGGTVGAALPTADASGTANLAASGGKVALVRDATALTCGAAPGSCDGATLIEDLVGYGAATDYEGAAPAAALGNSTALVRAGAGCLDTGANAADFAVADPLPRTSASIAATCATTVPVGTTASAGVTVDVQPVLSIALERTSVGFGATFPGDTPGPVSERVTVVSSDPAGYVLAVHRSAFVPADL
ncbi:MAG: uncharacterized protein QOF43_1284, partial [Gaiellaceae bacterium]|nr:uncharacterized protein [Gaiellaceae bacterium]